MKLGTSTINIGLGAASVRGGYVGHLSLTQAPDGPAPSLYPLYEEVGDWAAWGSAPAYTPTLAAPVFNILDYGADPTNTTDSTPAINSALAALAAAEGGTLYIPEGVYLIIPPEGEELENVSLTFPLYTSGTVVEGDGPDKSILNCRAFGGADPASLILKRGNLFGTIDAPAPVDGVTIRGIRATGNAPPNNDAGQWTLAGHATGWDIHHKFFYVGGGQDVTNVLIEKCELDNWRGEICYAGGGLELGVMEVRENIIRGCNASAISMGGFITIHACEIYDAYNGAECFMLGGLQSLDVTDCTIELNRNNLTPGAYAIAFLGYLSSNLNVTGNTIGKCNSGVLLSEMANNVIVDNNSFTDCKAVYVAVSGGYDGNPNVDQDELNKWRNITITNNTVTALTVDVPAVVQHYGAEGENWNVSSNTALSTGGNTVLEFIETQAGVSNGFSVASNTISDSRPLTPYSGPRPVWADSNSVTGDYALGTEINTYTAGPFDIYPTWTKVRVSDLSGSASVITYQVNPANLADFPEGFILEIRRSGSNDQFSGIEIIPDANWNSLSRGYVVYAGGVLKMTVGIDGKFGFTSWTPNTVSIPTLQQFGGADSDVSKITFYGQLAINLSPTVAHTFDTFSGVAIGETVTINVNANVTLSHVPGVLEMSNGVDYVSAGTVALSATRAADGTLEVTIP